MGTRRKKCTNTVSKGEGLDGVGWGRSEKREVKGTAIDLKQTHINYRKYINIIDRVQIQLESLRDDQIMKSFLYIIWEREAPLIERVRVLAYGSR